MNIITKFRSPFFIGIVACFVAIIGLTSFISPESKVLDLDDVSACDVYGKIKIVDYGEDFKVKRVDYGQDLKVKWVDYGQDNKGKWKRVDYGEDYKIKYVDYGEDFKIKNVDYGEGC